MRLLNQMLNLSGIFDCYSVLIQTSHLKAVTSRIKLVTCEIRRLNWVMVTVSTVSCITINTGRYAMIHMAFLLQGNSNPDTLELKMHASISTRPPR